MTKFNFTFDGMGFNDQDTPFKSRIATLSVYGRRRSRAYYEKLAHALNTHADLVQALEGVLAAAAAHRWRVNSEEKDVFSEARRVLELVEKV